jgi:Mrp family chromosome partitioning ATPase
MVRAAERGGKVVPSSLASVERTLDRTIEVLTSGSHTREARALLIEARRLRSVVANWRSIPPPPAVHDEMLERVLQLSTSLGIAFPDGGGLLQPEPEADAYPQITVGDVQRPDDAPDSDAYSLDFEPHLYSLETSARREAIPPPAPPHRAEPATGSRAAGLLRPQPAPAPAPVAAAPNDPYAAVASGGAAMRPAPAAQAWTAPKSAAMPVLEDEGTPYLVVTRSSPPPDEPPPTQPRPRALVAEAPPPAAARPATVPPPAAARPATVPPPARAPSVPPEPITRPSNRPPAPVRAGSPLPPPPLEDVAPTAPAAPADLGLDPAEGDPLGVPRTAVTAVAVAMSDPMDPLIVFLLEPYSPRADAYRAVRRKLTSSGNPRVIGVTSANKAEGKTTLAVNLALTLREGARGQVLLIEANLIAPSFSRLFGFPPPVCFLLQLAQHLEDPRRPWVAAEPMARLHVMGIDATIKHPPLLDSVAFTSGMERLLQAGYEYIVIDSPPVLGSVNCNVITDSVEGMIFSALPMVSRRKEMRKAVEQLEPAACFGVVVLDA